MQESGEVEKVMRKVQGLNNWARPEKDEGMSGPSRHAGMPPILISGSSLYVKTRVRVLPTRTRLSCNQ
ncbi:MAG: hypothetical protein OJF51_001096 [Nitrospira sp.]|jgi:hypothetical protein|nr:MAG: hypothetical protein OJF51_001096 [Nitrospira sp.]